MSHDNMGLWDKIVGNCRQYQGEMRAQWVEPVRADVDRIAGQQDALQGRIEPIAATPTNVLVRPLPRWKHLRKGA